MIKGIQLIQIMCDSCRKSIFLEHWKDAAKLGWCVPIDGAFQKCPECTKKYKEKLFNEVKLTEIAR